MLSNFQIDLNMALAHAERAGIGAPPALREAHAQADDYEARLAVTPPSAEEIADAIMNAKGEPAADKCVQTLATQWTLGAYGPLREAVGAQVERERERLLRQALAEVGDEFLATLADKIAEGVACLIEAVQRFGMIELDPKHAASYMHDTASASMYASALLAEECARNAMQAVNLLVQLLGIDSAPAHILVDDPHVAAEFDMSATPWRVVARGVPVSPPRSVAEFRERMANVSRMERDARRRAEEARELFANSGQVRDEDGNLWPAPC